MAGIRVLVRDSGGVLALDFPTATGWRIGLTPSNFDQLAITKDTEVNGRAEVLVAQFNDWIGVSLIDDTNSSELDGEK